MPSSPSQPLSVSDVARTLQGLISQNMPPLWIRGEVSNFKVQPNGTAFFSLKDSDAKLNAVIMNHSRARKALKDIRNGTEIIALGNCSYYKKEGSISVFIEDVELMGEGLLKKQFEELKARLSAEGLFDKERKKAIPRFPAWVGIVTSPTGAAIKDILNVTARRASGVHILLFPAAVQGEGAAREIAQAVEIANRLAGSFLDVLIVGRGGGSIEDLWCFNEEIVARAIAASSIPVISAVGHEIDYTISDYVADLRAPTPSAAAEIVTVDRAETLRYVENQKNRLERHMDSRLTILRQTLQARGSAALQRLLQAQVTEARLDLNSLQNRFKNHYRTHFQELKNRIELLKGKLSALNPLAILERGYSITFVTGLDGKKKALKSVRDAVKDSEIQTRLADGELRSTVK